MAFNLYIQSKRDPRRAALQMGEAGRDAGTAQVRRVKKLGLRWAEMVLVDNARMSAKADATVMEKCIFGPVDFVFSDGWIFGEP